MTRRSSRGVLAGVIGCLFFMQAVAFVFSSQGRLAFASGDGGTSIAMAGEICHAAAPAGETNDGAPAAPSRHHRHCGLCALACHDPHAGIAIALLTGGDSTLAPNVDGEPAWVGPGVQAPLPLGWNANRSSRAPPRMV
jgi:hypothetical protein